MLVSYHDLSTTTSCTQPGMTARMAPVTPLDIVLVGRYYPPVHRGAADLPHAGAGVVQ
jgi:hypothetical protein